MDLYIAHSQSDALPGRERKFMKYRNALSWEAYLVLPSFSRFWRTANAARSGFCRSALALSGDHYLVPIAANHGGEKFSNVVRFRNHRSPCEQ
jgi:hypothetical protein